MKVQKRISKKQIKGDRLVSTTFKATEYVQKNQTPFIVGSVVLIVILALVLLLRTSANRKNDEASALLSRGEMIAASGNVDQYVADLRRLADVYQGTPAGKVATVRLANNYFYQKQYDDAKRYFQLILDHYADDNLLSAGASAGLGAVYELQGQYLDAAKSYRRAVEFTPDETWTPGYLLKAGQNFAKAGDKVSAEEAFGEIEKKFANSTDASAARRALAALKY